MLDVNGVIIGEKNPKICVPLVGNNLGGLLREAGLAGRSDIDLAEWRADLFDDILNHKKLSDAFSALRKAFHKPILFTVRTVGEGGNLNIPQERYFDLLRNVICKLKPDLIDIELSCGEKNCRELVAAARSNSVITVLSSHNFKSTPPYGDMLYTLNEASKLGGDIAKLAVMPDTPADVLSLLSVSESFSRSNPDTPVIAIAMGGLGKISRVSGGFFGSSITFASLEKASAPGQIPFDDMRKMLDTLCF